MNKWIHILSLIIALNLLGTRPAFGEAAWQGKAILEVTSPVFAAPLMKEISDSLALEVGSRLDFDAMDVGIRNLVKRGKVESIFVEVKPKGSGIAVTLLGRVPQKIRNIKFKGIEPEIVNEARGNIIIRPGEITDTTVLAELREKVKEAYSRRGYFDAEIDLKIITVPGKRIADVEISAKPGTRTIIGSVNVIGVSEELEKEILNAFDAPRGSAFQLEELPQKIAAVTDFLADNRYYGAKVEQHTLEYSENRDTVTINLFIKLGNRFQVVFSGNTVFSDWQLREILRSEKMQNINAIKKFATDIETKYQQVGYHFCVVEIREQFNKADRTNTIFFDVREGPKVRIGRIDFSKRAQMLMRANTLSRKELTEIFYKGAPGVVKRRLYWKKGMEVTVKAFSRSLRKMGYLNANVGEPKAVFTSNRRQVDLFFDIELGTRTRVGGIQCIGNQRFSNRALVSHVPFVVGDDYNPSLVSKGATALSEYYQEEGYVDIEVESDLEEDVVLSRDKESVLIKYRIKEGLQYRVGTITIEGNRKTKDSVIRRKLKLEEGGVYSPQARQASEEAVSLLGLFAGVEISSLPTEKKGIVDVKVNVREIAPGVAEFGVGATYEDPLFRLRAFGGIGYSNLFGLNNTSSLRGEVRFPISGQKTFPFLEYFTTVGYLAPYPFGWPIKLSAQLGVDSFQIAFDGNTRDIKTRATVELKVEKKLARNVTGFYRLYRLERTNTENFDLNHNLNPSESRLETIGSTGPGLLVDFRNDIFNPTTGSYHLFDIELGHPALLSQSDIAFIMFLSRNSFYFPLVSPFSITAFVGAGYAKSLKTGKPVPQARLINELSLGGQPSIRGFTIRQFQPDSNAEESAFINARAELGVLLATSFKLVLFFDSGQLFPRLSGSSSYNRHDGFGVGARYETPVGPIAIDFAHGIGADGRNLQFYFSIGTL